MAFSADAIANYFLELAQQSGRQVSPMKLQKLMYFAHGFHLSLEREGKSLIRENAQAWEYGPVFPSAYHEFKDFGNNPIDRKAFDVEDGPDGGIVLYEPSIADEAHGQSADVEFALAVLDRIWAVYAPHPAEQLSQMTHEEGSPWWTVREQAKKRFGGKVPRGLSIPNGLIRSWFKNKFRLQAA